jgi:outer membrane protein assembly factor BamB
VGSNQAKLQTSLVLLVLTGSAAWGVTSRIHRQDTFQDFGSGEVQDVIIESRGALRLGREAEVLADDFERAWSINSITVIGGSVYFGTSPNGGIYRYHLGALERMYPLQDRSEPGAASDVNDIPGLTHEHVFATCADVAGRLVAAISGADCRLDRFSVDGIETLFRPDGAQYIFGVTTDDAGHLYVGTGPYGKIFRLDALTQNAQLVYTSRDDNILSVTVGPDGLVYAGSDGRGLVYRIHPGDERAAVLYDSPQPEVTALGFAPAQEGQPRGHLYALATSAQVVEAEREFAARLPLPGRPEPEEEGSEEKPNATGQGRQFQIASQQPERAERETSRPAAGRRRGGRETISTLWRIDPEGFVVDVAHERAVFFCMTSWGGKVLIGTGNEGRLLRVDPATEQTAVLYEDPQATQVTAVATRDEDVYLGTANPARLIKLGRHYALSGTFTSPLIDARQPAHWGRLQLDADLPEGCQVWVSCRSGNVDDANDSTFSPWTEPIEMTEPVPLGCPQGRFCQYKLILKSRDGTATPVIREVALASSIPNLPPVVDAVDFVRNPKSSKDGFVTIKYNARDANEDSLRFTVSFRKLGRSGWITLEEDHDTEALEWDSRTVEDGRYEVKILASDALGNSPATALTASRISDPLLVDNTGPRVHSHQLEFNGSQVILGLVVRDEFSAISRLEYTVDSHQQWRSAVPEDRVYDTREETFRILVEDLDAGAHVISTRLRDDLGNTTFRSFDLDIER